MKFFFDILIIRSLKILPLDYSNMELEKRPPYKFKSGAVYEGQWRGNVREGNGVQTWQDGAKYEGLI